MSAGFKVVPRFDPAIDAEAMGRDGVAAYRDTGDFSRLVFRDQMKPVVFHCRRLKVSEMQAARGHTTDSDVYVACFARGVERVTDLYCEDGSRRDWTRPDADRPITSREIDLTFDAGEVLEVGAAIYGRSILGKGRPAAWPQPATSQLAVEALVLRLVEQTRLSVSSARSKSEDEEPPAATSGG